MTARNSDVSKGQKVMEVHRELPQLCSRCSAGSKALLLERSERRAGREAHWHLSSLLMRKACYFAQQLHYYLSIIFGREFRVVFYRFMLFVPSSHWEMEISRQERGEHYIVLSKRNLVLNRSIWERYDH